MGVSDGKGVYTVNPVMLPTRDMVILQFPTQNRWLGLLGSTCDQGRTKINTLAGSNFLDLLNHLGCESAKVDGR